MISVARSQVNMIAPWSQVTLLLPPLLTVLFDPFCAGRQ